MSGSAGLFNKKIFFFYLVGSPKVGGAGDGKHNKKYGHPKNSKRVWHEQKLHIMRVPNFDL